MRMLNTKTGQFEVVLDPANTKYAILSHTWDTVAGEQDYLALKNLQSSLLHLSGGESILSQRAVSRKIREACRVALSDGYQLLWVDACCIDTNSSTELLESLNSMFEWYRLARVCYVYLADVPSTDVVERPGSAFRASRWHRRGWTLQELIAPTNVVFLFSDWDPFGTKRSLAVLLESVTGIDVDILLHKAPLSSVSVARRMWWASSRQTTKVEDEAYALMGIFNVKIPMVYGEGRRAFVLLQEEIWRAIPDQSLLAWGPKFPSKRERASAASLLRLIQERMAVLDTPLTSFQRPTRSLLASSPSDFRTARMITPMPTKQFLDIVWGSSGQQGQPEQTTAYIPSMHGSEISLPIISHSSSTLPGFSLRAERNTARRDCACGPFEFTSLALLQCMDDAENLIALPLCEPPASIPESLLVGTRKDVCLDCKRYCRTCVLPSTVVCAIRTRISITPLIIRRIPPAPEPCGTPPLRIRRIHQVQSSCKHVLAKEGYQVSLHRTTTNEHVNGHSLILRHHSCDDVSQNLVAHVEEIEVHIAQGERTDGVSFIVRYGDQLPTGHHGGGGDLGGDTVPSVIPDPSSLACTTSRARGTASTRVSQFVPFTELGVARYELELGAMGGAAASIQKLYVTLSSDSEPEWTHDGWGRAPHVDFSLNVELSPRSANEWLGCTL